MLSNKLQDMGNIELCAKEQELTRQFEEAKKKFDSLYEKSTDREIKYYKYLRTTGKTREDFNRDHPREYDQQELNKLHSDQFELKMQLFHLRNEINTRYYNSKIKNGDEGLNKNNGELTSSNTHGISIKA